MTPKTMSSSHPVLIDQLLQTRKVLQELCDAMEPLKFSGDVTSLYRASDAVRAAVDLLAGDPV